MGSRIFDTKRRVISGTPLTISIKPMQTHLTSGSLDLRPNARRTPTGSDNTIPDSPTIKFSMKPPNLSEATFGSPNPPTRRMVAITGYTTEKILRYFWAGTLSKSHGASAGIKSKKAKKGLHLSCSG